MSDSTLVADHLAEIRWVLVGWDDGQTNCGFPPYLLLKDPGTAGRTESFWIYPSRGLEFLRRLLQDKTSQTHARSTLVAVRPAQPPLALQILFHLCWHAVIVMVILISSVTWHMQVSVTPTPWQS